MRHGCTPREVTIGVFALAFAVRLAWALRVQSPLTAVFSDMGGYVERAQWLIAGTTPTDPGAVVFYPWGAHCFIGLELALFGRNAPVAIAVVHAIVGAVPAACVVPLTLRLLPSLAAAAAAGAIVALWQPQVVYVGFFLSEIWFSAAIALQALLSARRAKRGRSLAVGLLSATAFVVRPQFLLTWLVDTAAHVASRFRRRGAREAGVVLAWLGVPMVLALAMSSARLHHLSGHWGLISDNANLNRLFADTDVCRVESTFVSATGKRFGMHFAPPAKPPCDEADVVRFDGYIGDARILDAIRRGRLRGVSWTDRLLRAGSNVALLVVKNQLFPENGYTESRFRTDLQRGFASALLYGFLPLSVVGLVLGRPDRLKLLALANFAAVAVAAARYYGEARYRVPYDPFVILFAVVGAYELGTRGLAFARNVSRSHGLVGPGREGVPSCATGAADLDGHP
jgi:hypothetical protein